MKVLILKSILNAHKIGVGYVQDLRFWSFQNKNTELQQKLSGSHKKMGRSSAPLTLKAHLFEYIILAGGGIFAKFYFANVENRKKKHPKS